jgi:gamma-glutamyltranspeptidase / glutathione hydrolase
VTRADDERVADIVEAASEIAAIVDAGEEAWESDHVRRLAVERLLEIIGEFRVAPAIPPLPPEIGAAAGIAFLGHGRFQAAAEPVRGGGGSALVVHPLP